MQLLISDANIFIDLKEAGLMSELFQIGYQINTPDILFAEELSEQHGDLLTIGLVLLEISPEYLMQTATLSAQNTGVSFNDCLALSAAQQTHGPLLTGDGKLRQLAQQRHVEVKGTIWVIEQMLTNQLINTEQARTAAIKMQQAGRRLPWNALEKVVARFDLEDCE